MVYLNLLKIVCTKLLTAKVPVWTALILAIALAYYVTRPPKVVTQIAYSQRFEPLLAKYPLNPNRIVFYRPFLTEKIRVDTIRVPDTIERYYLIERNRISSIPRGLRLDVWNTDDTRYESWQFVVPEPNLSAKIGFEAGMHLIDYNSFVGFNVQLSYKQTDLFANARLLPNDYALVAGVRYNFINLRIK